MLIYNWENTDCIQLIARGFAFGISRSIPTADPLTLFIYTKMVVVVWSKHRRLMTRDIHPLATRSVDLSLVQISPNRDRSLFPEI